MIFNLVTRTTKLVITVVALILMLVGFLTIKSQMSVTRLPTDESKIPQTDSVPNNPLVKHKLYRTVDINPYNTILVAGEIDERSVDGYLFQIIKIQEAGATSIRLILQTPGGSVMDGMRLIDALLATGLQVDTVTVEAASMGFIIAQAMPGKRMITPHGLMMTHRAAMYGEPDESVLEWLEALDAEIAQMVAARVGLSIKEYRKIEKREKYSMGEQAIRDGFADEIVNLNYRLTK